jgi:hypothetical protein
MESKVPGSFRIGVSKGFFDEQRGLDRKKTGPGGLKQFLPLKGGVRLA